MPLVPGARFGEYEIVTLLGTVDTGRVYRARDARLQRDVAIKSKLSATSPPTDRDLAERRTLPREVCLEASGAIAVAAGPRLGAVQVFAAASRVSVLDL